MRGFDGLSPNGCLNFELVELVELGELVELVELVEQAGKTESIVMVDSSIERIESDEGAQAVWVMAAMFGACAKSVKRIVRRITIRYSNTPTQGFS